MIKINAVPPYGVRFKKRSYLLTETWINNNRIIVFYAKTAPRVFVESRWRHSMISVSGQQKSGDFKRTPRTENEKTDVGLTDLRTTLAIRIRCKQISRRWIPAFRKTANRRIVCEEDVARPYLSTARPFKQTIRTHISKRDVRVAFGGLENRLLRNSNRRILSGDRRFVNCWPTKTLRRLYASKRNYKIISFKFGRFLSYTHNCLSIKTMYFF